MTRTDPFNQDIIKSLNAKDYVRPTDHFIYYFNIPSNSNPMNNVR